MSTVCLVSICLLWWSEDVFALERTALALAGSSCRESQRAIIEALKDVDGVAGVETELIPDHVLIDHDDRKVNEDQLAVIINTLPGLEGGCQAALMRSCITAHSNLDGFISSRAR